MNLKERNPIFLNWIDDGKSNSFEMATDQVVIGRDDNCDLVLNFSHISRHHAQVSHDKGRFFIEDLDSSMGTRLNGHPLRPGEKLALRSGDQVRVGKLTLTFDAPASSEGEESTLSEHRFVNSNVVSELKKFEESIMARFTAAGMGSGSLKSGVKGDLTALTESIRGKFREYEVLQEITQIIVRILDVKELLSTALKLVSEVLGADRGFIILYDPKHGSLRSMIPRHFDRDSGAYQFDLSFSQTIARNCYDMKKIIIIDDALEDDRFRTSQSIVASSIRSVICIPLQHGNEVSGVIYLDNLSHKGCFKKHQTDFLKAFSCQTAIALENARLYTQAVTDGMTRLYNRKFANERIFEEMVRSRRYERSCSVIMVDIDHFKSVNDNYGHDFGDFVLELVANVLRESARTSDVVARYGGEEFLLLLTETDKDGAIVFAERLRQSIEGLKINKGGQTLKVTASLGVSGYHPDLRNDVSAFVKQADTALYKAKNSGRNRVCGADE